LICFKFIDDLIKVIAHLYEFKTNQTRMLEQQQQLETYKNKTPLTNQIIHTSEQHTKLYTFLTSSNN
jgi:hypothetical protein